MKRGLTKARVREWLQRRYWLRVHMFFIVGVTFAAGLSATKLLLLVHVDVLALRYGLAVIAAYLAFLAMIRLWLWYVSAREGPSIDFTGNGIDIFNWSSGSSAPDLGGGGGSFGGGGATGSWGDAGGDLAAAPAKVTSSVGGKGCLPSLDLDLDGEGCVLVLLVIALIAVVLFAGVYLIYTAPAILSEAAFEALLAGALARRAKSIAHGGWVGSVFRATVWIFLAVLAFSVALGWYAQKHCPHARRLRDAIQCAR